MIKTKEMETYLNDEQIKALVRVFANEEQFTEHLSTLWALREIVGRELEAGYIDESHPHFKVFNLTNKLIGAIDDGTVEIVNGVVKVNKRYRRW